MATSNRPTTAERLRSLQEEVRELRAAVSVTYGLDSIAEGVSEIAELIAPLRSLAPPPRGEPLGECAGQNLADLLTALARPSWGPVVSLDVVEPSLRYIGDRECPPPAEKVSTSTGSGEPS